MIADGNGEFTEALGLSFDGSKFGMGKRSQRYSMVVNDGMVEQLNVEAPGDYRVFERGSDARAALIPRRNGAKSSGRRRTLSAASLVPLLRHICE